MGLEFLLDNQKRIRMGGWAVGLGPLSFHLGGRWYTVARLSVLRWFQVVVHLSSAGVPLECLIEDRYRIPESILHLILSEPLRARDAKRASWDQVLCALTACGMVNDLPYLIETMKRRTPTPSEEVSEFNLLDEIDVFCTLRPQYKHEGVKDLAAQEYFGILDSIDKRRPVPEGETSEGAMKAPEFDHPPTLEELTRAMGQVGYHG